MLNHKGTIRIETERFVLRRFTMEDASSMFCNWTSDMDVCKYMRWLPHSEEEETKKVLESWTASYEKIDFYQWAITLKEKEEPIGSIALLVANENDLCGDFGYCIGKKYWGQGIATEVLKSILTYAFDIIGFNRIEAYHSINNPASGMVMQKAGMVLEGLAKQKYRSISGFEDSNLYSIIKKDFIINNVF